MDHHIIGVNDPVVDNVVGDGKQRPDEYFIGLSSFRKPCIAINAHVGQALGVEPAFGSGGHDNGVFHPLRLHQAKNLRAEVITPVGPAQATAGDRSGTQMDTLQPR